MLKNIILTVIFEIVMYIIVLLFLCLISLLGKVKLFCSKVVCVVHAMLVVIKYSDLSWFILNMADALSMWFSYI